MGTKKKISKSVSKQSARQSGRRPVKQSVKRPATIGQRMSGLKVWQLLVLLAIVVLGAVLFVGAVSGWFSDIKVVLDAEYYCSEECDGELMELSGAEYEDLINEGKSFVLFVDQSGCLTADKLKQYMKNFANEAGIKAYQMMFADARQTSLHDYVKYYPSVVMVSRGKVVRFLRADSDEDSDMYNDYEAFYKWMKKYL